MRGMRPGTIAAALVGALLSKDQSEYDGRRARQVFSWRTHRPDHGVASDTYPQPQEIFLNPRRPSRGPGGASRGPGNNPTRSSDDSPAQTNLGLLLQRALEAAKQQPEAEQTVAPEEAAEAVEERETKLCANCWNALTFKDDSGRHMARCAKDLWIKPSFAVDDLNKNRVRRWYADCPAYDDEE